VVKKIKADQEVGQIPVMLVTNYEEHQQVAIEAGCVRGFGKLALGDPATAELLQPYLGK
jgi:CheY-like chemotaxis protein